MRILKATFLAGGLEEMDLEELLPLVTGNAAMKLPGLVFASAAQGTVNAFMTIRVGILTKNIFSVLMDQLKCRRHEKTPIRKQLIF